MDKKDIGFAMPQWAGNPAEELEDFKTHLDISDGIIVIWGQAEAKWAREQLKECRKAASRSARKILIIALYDGPPEGKPSLNYKLPYMVEIKCRDCLREEAFAPFMEALRQRRTT
jgi:hypothetical protein